MRCLSYLSKRKQFVQARNIKTSSFDIICGVRQGFVLGPLLFRIYVNNLSQQTFTCSKSTIEALEKGVEYVQS